MEDDTLLEVLEQLLHKIKAGETLATATATTTATTTATATAPTHHSAATAAVAPQL